MFDRYGPRVPAVVISPWCPQNLIEHRQLEHSFIPATIEQLFGLGPLTNRDAGVVGLQTLATLATPRNVTTPIPDAHAAAEPGGPVPGTPAGSSGTVVSSAVGSISGKAPPATSGASGAGLRRRRRRAASPSPLNLERPVAGVGAGGCCQSTYGGGAGGCRKHQGARFRTEDCRRSGAVPQRHHADRPERTLAGATEEGCRTKAACFADRRGRGSATGCHSPGDRKADVGPAAAGSLRDSQVLRCSAASSSARHDTAPLAVIIMGQWMTAVDRRRRLRDHPGQIRMPQSGCAHVRETQWSAA